MCVCACVCALSFKHYYPYRSGRDPISRHPCRGIVSCLMFETQKSRSKCFQATEGSCPKPYRKTFTWLLAFRKSRISRDSLSWDHPEHLLKLAITVGMSFTPPENKNKNKINSRLKNAQTRASSQNKNETNSENERNKTCVTQPLQLSSNPAGPLTGVTGCRWSLVTVRVLKQGRLLATHRSRSLRIPFICITLSK